MGFLVFGGFLVVILLLGLAVDALVDRQSNSSCGVSEKPSGPDPGPPPPYSRMEISALPGSSIEVEPCPAPMFFAPAENRIREIAREEISVWMKEQERPPVSVTTTNEPPSTTYTVTRGLVCPLAYKECAYVGRQGTRAGGGLFCTRNMQGESVCPEGVRFDIGEKRPSEKEIIGE